MNNFKLMKRIRNSLAFNYLLIAIGLALCVLGYNLFLIPNDIAAGGFTGLAQLINSLTGLPVGLMMLCMNVPLFAFSLKSMGKSFAIRSGIASALLSVLIDVIKLPAAAEDIWLATVYGGILSGAGFGLILCANATTGGTDMLASIVHKFVPSIPVGTAITLFDGIIIVASAFVFNTTSALYALITVIICNSVVNFVLEGPGSAQAFFIISNDDEKIAEMIMTELERGVTGWSAEGMYSKQEKRMLLCAVSRRETVTLRRIVYSVDPKAFIISAKAHETYGEGFKPLRR